MGAAPILTILRDGEEIRSVPLDKEAVLGRAEGCVIRLEDRAISRLHAVFKPVGDNVQVEKKSEFAPLIVNGADCTRAMLKEGDVISIGPYLMKFSNPSNSANPKSKGASAPAGAQLGEEAGAALGNPGGSLDGLADIGGVPLEKPPGKLEEAALDAQALGQGAPLVEGGGQALTALPEENAEFQEAALSIDQGSSGIELKLEGASDAALGEAPSPGEPGSSPQVEEAGGTKSVIEIVDDDAKTRVAAPEKVAMKLVFKAGSANHEEFDITQNEVSIGRGKQCTIILNDKKSSRKNAVIRREGLGVFIKDLESANGTYVNGNKIADQELSSGDVIRIGETEFQILVKSSDYSSKEADFLSIPAQAPEEAAEGMQPDFSPVPIDESIAGMSSPVEQFPEPSAGAGMQGSLGAQPGLSQGSIPGLSGIPGLTGVPGFGGVSGSEKKGGLLAKFNALPKQKRIIYLVVALAAAAFLLPDSNDSKPAAKKGQPKAAAVAKAQPSFDTLSPEQKAFVENQHKVAFDYYKNGEFDQAIFEIEKIFTIIPDYLDSREIDRYAKEGKREKEAKEEERKKKEEEAKAKARVAELVDKARKLMDQKQYEPAKDIFSEILSLDPENPLVADWKKTIDDAEERKRVAEQEKQVQQEINKHAWEVYDDGIELKKEGKYQTAIETLSQIKDIGSSDRKVVVAAAGLIKKCRALIIAARDPVMDSAKQAEDVGDFAKAFDLYQKAARIDRGYHAAYAGADRVRGILHDRAKSLYTEAILAESYSDFATAKRKFKECEDTAPKDDEYHDRAERKLVRYFKSAVQEE